MCGMRTCTTTQHDMFKFKHAINVILPLSLLPPPPTPFFSHAKFGLNVRMTDNGPANTVGSPTEGTWHPAAIVTQWLSFFFVFLSHLFACRETVVLQALHTLVPHHPGATASLHVASHHPSPTTMPATSPHRHAHRLTPPWKHVAPMAVVCKSSPCYLAPTPHPLTTQRCTLGTTTLPSPLLMPPLHFGTPRHHSAQDPPPHHTTPPWHHIAASHHPTTSPHHTASPDMPTMPLLLPPPAALGHHPTLCTSSCM